MTWRERKEQQNQKEYTKKKAGKIGSFCKYNVPGSGKHKPLSLK